MKSQQVHGIVIRTTSYGDNHKVVTLFTKEKGKISVMAHGAKKTKGKLAGVTQLFTNGQYLVSFGRTIGMGTMKQGETAVRYKSIQQDIIKTTYASIIVELMDNLLVDNEPNLSMFELLESALQLIEQGIDPQLISFMVEAKLLSTAGIHPNIDGCACCKNHYGCFAFSVKEGGFICYRCFGKDANRIPVTSATVRIFCVILNIDLSKLGAVNVKEKTKQEISCILTHLYSDYAGVVIKSKGFVKELEKLMIPHTS